MNPTVTRHESDIIIAFYGLAGERYRIDYNYDITIFAWSPATPDLSPTTDGPVQVVFPYAITKAYGYKFYRIIVLP